MITQTLKERFGLQARLQDPHLAVAKGAALFALMQKVKVSMLDEARVQRETAGGAESGRSARDQRPAGRGPGGQTGGDSCAARIRYQGRRPDDPVFKTDPDRAREYIAHLLTANTPLPADTGPETFRTVYDNQREVKLEVWEQAGSVASEELEHNTHIGEGLLTDLPPRPAGAPFQVVFHMTEMGLLKVHGREADSGREVRFEIQIGGLDEADVRKAANAVARYEVSG